MDNLVVAETFYSLQGEGQYIGFPAVFLRLGGCNLKCGFRYKNLISSWVCDTRNVWNQSHSFSIEELGNHFEKSGFINNIKEGANLVITGGEPLLQQKNLIKFINYLSNTFNLDFLKSKIEIETNGTIEPLPNLSRLVDIFNISPKLSSSNEPLSKRLLKFIPNRTTNAIFKFVISEINPTQEINEILEIIEKHNLDKTKIYLMPSGESKEEIEKNLGQVSIFCKELHFKLSTRLHLHIWNKKTGV